MDPDAPLPPFAAIVVAAGKGLRVGGGTPKQYRMLRGKPLIRWSVEELAYAGADVITAVVSPDAEADARAALAGVVGLRFVHGGATRQESVRAGLEALAGDVAALILR